MKYFLAFILFILLQNPAQAQNSYMIEAGINVNAISPSGLNTILSRYNRNLSNNSDPFNLIHQMHGYSILAGAISGSFYYEAGYHYQTKTVQAINRRSTIREAFEISPVARTGSLGFGFVINQEQFLIIPGFRIYGGKLQILSTKTSLNDPLNPVQDELYSTWFSESSFFVRFVLPIVTIEPYYTMSINRFFGNGNIYNLADLNQQINPNGYQFDGRQVPYDASGFGVRLTFGFWSIFY